jgi:hypothetical protein
MAGATRLRRVVRPVVGAAAAMVLGGGMALAAGPTGTSTAAVQAAKRPSVPAGLTAVESAAEDLVDLAFAKNRSAMAAKGDELVAAATGPAATALAKAGASPRAIATLTKRAKNAAALVRRAPYLRVAIAANEVSALMPAFYARFDDPVPPEVLTLDFLDRDAQLSSLAGDEARVTSAVDRLARTWAGLRGKVVAARGAAIARQFTTHVSAMKRLAAGRDRAALQREAVNGLELVDEIERVFAG